MDSVGSFSGAGNDWVAGEFGADDAFDFTSSLTESSEYDSDSDVFGAYKEKSPISFAADQKELNANGDLPGIKMSPPRHNFLCQARVKMPEKTATNPPPSTSGSGTINVSSSSENGSGANMKMEATSKKSRLLSLTKLGGKKRKSKSKSKGKSQESRSMNETLGSQQLQAKLLGKTSKRGSRKVATAKKGMHSSKVQSGHRSVKDQNLRYILKTSFGGLQQTEPFGGSNPRKELAVERILQQKMKDGTATEEDKVGKKEAVNHAGVDGFGGQIARDFESQIIFNGGDANPGPNNGLDKLKTSHDAIASMALNDPSVGGDVDADQVRFAAHVALAGCSQTYEAQVSNALNHAVEGLYEGYERGVDYDPVVGSIQGMPREVEVAVHDGKIVVEVTQHLKIQVITDDVTDLGTVVSTRRFEVDIATGDPKEISVYVGEAAKKA